MKLHVRYPPNSTLEELRYLACKHGIALWGDYLESPNGMLLLLEMPECISWASDPRDDVKQRVKQGRMFYYVISTIKVNVDLPISVGLLHPKSSTSNNARTDALEKFDSL